RLEPGARRAAVRPAPGAAGNDALLLLPGGLSAVLRRHAPAAGGAVHCVRGPPSLALGGADGGGLAPGGRPGSRVVGGPAFARRGAGVAFPAGGRSERGRGARFRVLAQGLGAMDQPAAGALAVVRSRDPMVE